MAALTRGIGGALGLDPRTLAAARASAAAALPGRSVASGRTALRLIARTLDGPVLLPSYLCAAMMQPFREENVQASFYAVREDLTTDLEDLAAQVRRVEPAAVVAVAYFGFPIAPEIADLRGDALLVEDCVHGSLLEWPDPVVGTHGDFAFTSFRKYLPVPDGGVVTGPLAGTLPELPPACGSHVADHLLARTLRGAVVDAPDVENAFVQLEHRGEQDLDEQTPLEGTSEISLRLLGALDLAAAASRRRENYCVLADALAEDALVPELPERVSPLVFPVRVAGDRDALRERLRALRVFAPVYWPLPEGIDPVAYPDAASLSRTMLGLPVDQRYDGDDMRTLVERFRRAA